MVTLAVTEENSFTEGFYNSLFEIEEGERIKTCLQCATCSGVCPFGYLMDFPPGKMISMIRADMFDKVIENDSVWMCISCYACTQVCPKQIPLTPGLMTRTKEQMLLAGNIPSELQSALEFSQRYGNPLGESPRKRADWTKGLTPEVQIIQNVDRPVDVLWFVGDYPSYHPRVQVSTKAFAKLLHALGIDFAILGREENSDGDSQRLAGERGLFEILAEKNGKVFEKYKFGEIITTDPHAYNALKNEYPKLGISYSVRHYTEFLAERVDQIKPLLVHGNETKVTFHDPCYLGRANGMYDEPRHILNLLTDHFTEMKRNRSFALCCGAGGAQMFKEAEEGDKEIFIERTEEALETGAKIIATACPFCMTMITDGLKYKNKEEEIKNLDIAEIIVRSLGI